jgi:hypothetical protein
VNLAIAIAALLLTAGARIDVKDTRGVTAEERDKIIAEIEREAASMGVEMGITVRIIGVPARVRVILTGDAGEGGSVSVDLPRERSSWHDRLAAATRALLPKTPAPPHEVGTETPPAVTEPAPASPPPPAHTTLPRAPAQSMPAPALVASPQIEPQASRVVPWLIIGGGAAAAAAGAGFALRNRSLADEGRSIPADDPRTDGLRSEADAMRIGAYIFYTAAVAAVSSGLTLLLTDSL